MKDLLILILFIWSSNGLAQNKPISTNEGLSIPYDTISLKKGYLLVFEKTESHRYLRLKGPSVDTILLQASIKAPEYYFGRLEMDHDDYFVLFNEGSCHGVWVIEKTSGKQILDGCLLTKDTIQNIFYFVDWKDDFKLGIFNMKTMEVELFPPPKTACNFWWDCLESKTLTESELTIEYYIPPNKKVKKTYPRQQD